MCIRDRSQTAISGIVRFSSEHNNALENDITRRDFVMQQWSIIWYKLPTKLKSAIRTPRPKLRKAIRFPHSASIEEFATTTWM